MVKSATRLSMPIVRAAELQIHVRLRSINPRERPFHWLVFFIPATKENAA
jgi:hypothetical protein